VAPRQSQIAAQSIQVPRRGDGHFYLTLKMNDVNVSFVVDTGASDVVLSRSDARRIGLNVNDLVFSGRATTANGTVTTAFARVGDVRLGDIRDKNLRVSVNGGKMNGSLLGMSYLRRFDSIEIKGDKLLLKR